MVVTAAVVLLSIVSLVCLIAAGFKKGGIRGIGVWAAAAGTLALDMGWQGWTAVGGLGLFSTAFAVALFQKGVFLCGGLKTSLYSTAEPLTAVAIGLAAFSETMTPAIGAGMACIVGAAAMSALVPVIATGKKQTVRPSQ